LKFLSKGKEIHNQIKGEIGDNLSATLIFMYGVCGDLKSAEMIFQKGNPSLSVFNSLLSILGKHGKAQEALDTFKKMNKMSIEPDQFTFAAILNACSHAGLLKECEEIFDQMNQFSFIPSVIHYNCMVDAFGRAGHLDKVETFISQMNVPPDKVTWQAFLSACLWNKDISRGEMAAKQMENAASFVSLANIYATIGDFKSKSQVIQEMKEKGINKIPAC
jgi:pentatricopeptide repeat protein